MTRIEQALKDTLGFGVEEFVKRAVEGGWLIPDEPFSSFFGKYPRDSFVDIEFFSYAYEMRVKFWHEKKDGGGVYTGLSVSDILLDPKSWQAVGKVSGWFDNCGDDCATHGAFEYMQAFVHRLWELSEEPLSEHK